MEQYLAEIEDCLYHFFESKDIKSKFYIPDPEKNTNKPVFNNNILDEAN